MPFFERFRRELRRYAAGVHLLSEPASANELTSAERRIGRPIPDEYLQLLRSWNGIVLFGETFELRAAGALASDPDRGVRIGDAPDGELWLDPEGRVVIEDDREDRLICGSTVERWLNATMAREALLIERDGEWQDVVSPDGTGLLLEVRGQRVRLAIKADPAAAAWWFESAELAFETGNRERAKEDLARAVAVDPAAAGAWELKASLHRQAEEHSEAAHALSAAAVASRAALQQGRRYAEAARAALDADQPAPADEYAIRAQAADPDLVRRLVVRATEQFSLGVLEEAFALARVAEAIGSTDAREILRQIRLRSALKIL